MTFTVEQQQMLCLAALIYRDFADAGPPSTHDRRLHDDVSAKLKKLEPLGGEWELVWGPSSYRAPVSLFDDAAMFVVRHVSQKNRYTVVVRGTNPISAFDWLFGDLWVSGEVPWPFDQTGKAKISLSSALGLDILVQLRAAAPSNSPVSGIFDDIENRFGGAAGALRDLALKPFTAVGTSVRDDLQRALAGLASMRVGMQGREPSERVTLLRQQWSAAVREPLLRAAAAGLTSLGGQPSMHLLALLEKSSWVEARLRGGYDLLSFLRATVAAATDPVEVTFTGHSKGGALAPTLALWFAENQGAVDATFAWDPQRRATVRCYHFAGPTAGNEAFAERSNGLIGERCFGFINPLDVVPQAWVPAKVARIGELYDPSKVVPIPKLGELAHDIAAVVTEQQLGYTHIGLHRTELTNTALEPNTHDFVGQLIYQHLQAYLEAMGIAGSVSVDTFFNPLR